MKLLEKPIRSRLLVAAILTAAALGLWGLVPGSPAEAAPAVHQGLAPITTPASFADVIAAVRPAVVNISSSYPAEAGFAGQGPGFPQGSPFDEFFRRFFDRQSFGPAQAEAPELRSLGSGFIVDSDGLVVTNNHVVEGASEILVTLNDGSQYPATLVGRDPKTDLALLAIEADTPLPYTSFGDSDSTRAGDWVIAIGNPFGLGGTATTGIVSARARDIRSGPFDDYLQIDAPINRGNSGGPLFDTSGRVIGVNTAIYSPNGGNVGIGFAIPASQAAPVVAQLRTEGHVQRGWLGVQIQRMDEEIASGLGLVSPDGALIASVTDGSPADKAGLEPGDVIVGFEGGKIADIRDLTREVAAVRPDSRVELEVWRHGKRVDIDLELGESPDDLAAWAGERESGSSKSASTAPLGLSLAPLTPESRQRHGVDEGVGGALIAAVTPGSPAARKGLRPGDVILRIGQAEVSSPAAVVEEVARLRKDDRPSVVFQIARGEQRQFLAVPLA